MPTVEVSFSALPSHVRTARLVALAVARRAGLAPELVDEVRLAVGEACTRAVALNAAREATALVELVLSEYAGSFTVEVVNVGPLTDDGHAVDVATLSPSAMTAASAAGEDTDPELLPDGFGLAVISGLVDSVEVAEDHGVTRVVMRWPLEPVVAQA